MTLSNHVILFALALFLCSQRSKSQPLLPMILKHGLVFMPHLLLLDISLHGVKLAQLAVQGGIVFLPIRIEHYVIDVDCLHAVLLLKKCMLAWRVFMDTLLETLQVHK